MTALLLALWPLFAIIVAGQWMRRSDFPGEAFWPAADRLNYFVLFPSLLFSSLVGAPLDNPALPRLALGIAATLATIWLALLVARHFLGWPAARFGVIAQGSVRFNTYLGLAVVGSLFGQPGLELAALLMAVMVPAVNVMSVWAFTAERGLSLRALLLPILRNPLILACLAGVAVNLTGIGLPLGSDRLLGLFAAASLPLGLLSVGAALQLKQLGGEWQALGGVTLARLLIAPVVAFTAAHLLGLPAQESLILVLFFALPTAPTAYVLARQLNGDSGLMASIITLQTLTAALSMPLVLGLLGITTAG